MDSPPIKISQSTELDLYEEGNPTLMDLLPKGLRDAYSRIPEDVKAMSDGELIKEMNEYSEHRAGRKGPSGNSRVEDRRRDIRLKHSLWYEYDQCIEQNRKMLLGNITKGILPQRNFERDILSDKMRVEWIMRPPLNYWNEQRVLLEKSTMGLHEILDIPVVRQVCRCNHFCICGRKGGQFSKSAEPIDCRCKESCICPPTYDSKIAQIKQKLHEMIEMRVKGALVQRLRVDKQSLIVQARASKAEIESLNEETSKTLPTTSQDIESELVKLRGEVKQLKSTTKVDEIIDITINEPQEAEFTAKGD